MLQRIQSIYLFLAGLAIFALYLFPLVHNVYVGSTPTSIMVTGSYTDPIVIIFLFRNRKQQIALSWSALLVIIGYSFWIAQAAKTITGDVTLKTANFGIGMLLCPVSIVLLIAAVRAIQRDEKLIRSADRLR
jgi:ABC-type transport system involved in cytochrome c biogenesis permease component